MQRIERCSRHLPMMLLVHVTQRDGVGKEQVQGFDRAVPCLVTEAEGITRQGAKALNFRRALTEDGLCRALRGVLCEGSIHDERVLSSALRKARAVPGR